MLDEERYRAILETKEAELVMALGRREGIEIEPAADVYDEGQRTLERDLAIDSLDRESILLRDVRAALKRLADGGYGVCLRCDAAISLRRLQALPWASLCLRCQEIADWEQSTGEAFTPTSVQEAA